MPNLNYFNSGMRDLDGFNFNEEILANPYDHESVSVVLNKETTGTIEVNGYTIVPKGTPLTGDMLSRTTPFNATATNDVVGILRHDTVIADDIGTPTTVNVAMVIEGVINLDRIDETTQATYYASGTSPTITALKGAVKFIRDN